MQKNYLKHFLSINQFEILENKITCVYLKISKSTMCFKRNLLTYQYQQLETLIYIQLQLPQNMNFQKGKLSYSIHLEQHLKPPTLIGIDFEMSEQIQSDSFEKEQKNAEDQFDTIIDWFKKRGIEPGYPDSIIEKHQSVQKSDLFSSMKKDSRLTMNSLYLSSKLAARKNNFNKENLNITSCFASQRF